MAKLVLKKKGQVIAEVVLDPSREWVAGRRPDADIVLDPEKGISRDHFKIFSENGQWKLQCLSKLNNVYLNGAIVETADLIPGSTFSVIPYEFDFFEDLVEKKTTEVVTADSFEDRTIIHKVALSAYIKILNDDGDLVQKIKLEGGDTWTAGRDVTAQIMISDHRVSRRQFEIRNTSLGYEIVDLGSVNGTYINEKLLEGHESVYLKSGDVIRILDHTLVFEIHDPQFFDKVENLPVPEYEQEIIEEVIVPVEYVAPGNLDQEAGSQAAPEVDAKAERTKKIRIAILIVAIVGGIFYMMDDGSDSGSKPVLSGQSPIADPLAGLTAQQKSEYKQSLELAKRYYMEGNYSLSLSEVEEILKTYKVTDPELDKLKNTALAAIETQKLLIKQEREEKERQAMEAKIAVTVEECAKKLTRYNREEELDNCLVEALQLNPAHTSIVSLKAKLQDILAEREAFRLQQEEYRKRVAQLKSLYDKAKSSEGREEYLDVIAAYKKVISSSLPDPKGYKKLSDRRLEELKIEMDKKIKEYEVQADQHKQKQELKQAVLTLRAAVKIDPTRSDLRDKADEIKNELRKLMMVYYQEGVLEESFGNVEGGDNRAGAKDKWKKILETDLEDGEYYKKAYIKMKKYGAH